MIHALKSVFIAIGILGICALGIHIIKLSRLHFVHIKLFLILINTFKGVDFSVKDYTKKIFRDTKKR